MHLDYDLTEHSKVLRVDGGENFPLKSFNITLQQ